MKFTLKLKPNQIGKYAMNTETNKVEIEVNEVMKVIEVLDDKANQKMIIMKVNEIIERLNEMNKSSGSSVKDIKSQRQMTEEDASRILLGDLKDKSNKDVALELGLSYGQIYSCRNGFTFKKIYKEFRAQQSTESDI
jgi:hypothetical protein